MQCLNVFETTNAYTYTTKQSVQDQRVSKLNLHENKSFVSNYDGVMLEIYLDHKFPWRHEGLNCESLAHEAFITLGRLQDILGFQQVNKKILKAKKVSSISIILLKLSPKETGTLNRSKVSSPEIAVYLHTPFQEKNTVGMFKLVLLATTWTC